MSLSSSGAERTEQSDDVVREGGDRGRSLEIGLAQLVILRKIPVDATADDTIPFRRTHAIPRAFRGEVVL